MTSFFPVKYLEYHDKGSKKYIAIRNRLRSSKKKYGIISYRIDMEKNGSLRKCIRCKEFVFKKGSNYFRGICISCHISENPDYYKNKCKKSTKKRRIKAFKKIQEKIECVRCGCNDIRLLEINHKNGGGRQTDFKNNRGGAYMVQAIVKDIRKTNDLEILCRPCNNIHYLEMKYGKLPIKVIWEGH